MKVALPTVISLTDLRIRASRFFSVLIWIHVVIVLVIAETNHRPFAQIVSILIILIGVALVASIFAWKIPGALSTRCIVAGAMTTGPALMVFAASGPWQIDWHMYFFVVFAMLVAFVDWRPIALSAILTAGHHLLFDLLAPAGVFPEPGFGRVVLHASMVAAECLVLFWIIAEMHLLFESASEALKRAHDVAGQLEHAASHDPLTQLANRALLSDRFDRAVRRSIRKNEQIAVLLIDLDRFKAINDALGHEVGDKVLQGVADRLRGCTRGGDTVSRFGGDEFVVLSAIESIEDATNLVARIHDAIAPTFLVNDIPIAVRASIGIALCPTDGIEPDSLLRSADMSMYRAKAVTRTSISRAVS